jgi:hypothetical protein
MSNPLDVTYVDLVGPPVSAAWLNAVTAGVKKSGNPLSPTTFSATAGQTVFTTPNPPSGFVFVDGVYQNPNSSYTWSGTTLTFSQGLHLNAQVTVL